VAEKGFLNTERSARLLGFASGGGRVSSRDDDWADRQVESLRERVIAVVVGRDGHESAGAVLHQHVVGDEHRDLLAVGGVGHGAAEGDAGLLAPLVAALGRRLPGGCVDVLAHLRLVRGA
jgi:hypothetical protein